MSYSRIILQDSVDVVWPLDDLTVTSSYSNSINFINGAIQGLSASINVNNTDVINNPIVFGGGTSLSLSSSTVCLSIPAMNRFSELYENKNSCIELWFKPSKLSSIEQTIFKKRNYENIGLFIKDNYLMFRYGTTASYVEVSADIDSADDPTHLILAKTPSSLTMLLNGISYSSQLPQNFSLEKDNNHLDNDYLDFYGPASDYWIVDSIALYSNLLSENDAKRHYVYGLGKNIGQDVFYHRGGSFYNLSTIDTEKLLKINWRYPQEWLNLNIVNLRHENDGLKSLYFSDPTFYSYDSNVVKSSNQISFKSSTGSTTLASYIDVKELFNKIDSGKTPLFIKIKLDGPLPKENSSQRVLTYGLTPDKELMYFDLYNNTGSYQFKIQAFDFYTSFNIQNAESQPDIFIGFSFSNQSLFYFSQTGSPVYTASFNYYDAFGFGLDPLLNYFPPAANSVVRIGSKLTYNKNNFSENIPSVEQFHGTFKKLFVYDESFSSSVNFSHLDAYNNSKYQVSYDSNLDRFKTFTYGTANFNIYAIDMAEFIDDSTQKIGSNVINFGYPDIQSSSQVQIFVTHLNYSGSVVYPKTLLEQNNFLNFINNKNLSGTYLKFDIELRAEDSSYYPPKVKYFNLETYKDKNGSVVLRDDSGSKYTLYPSSSSTVYLPEIKRTPTVYLSDVSGIKINNSILEFSENFSAKPLDPRTIDGLVLWLDSRFINGLDSINPIDDSKIVRWKDLSGNNFDAIQSNSASAPTFRVQSLNILTNNQGNGAENGTLENILSINCSASPSPDGAIQGLRSIKITPSGTSVDSYIDLGRNTASFTLAPNQSYSVVGSIKMLKPQTASYLHPDSRKIVIYTTDGTTETFTASTSAASNSASTTHLYAEFTTASNITGASIRCYNGSFSSDDVVYWDNIAVYPKQSGSYVNEWKTPLTYGTDSPTVNFNGKSNLFSSASVNQPYTLYTVGRVFNDGSLVGYSASGISIYSYEDYFYVNTASSLQSGSYSNSFNIFSVGVSNDIAKVYLNGEKISESYVGGDYLSSLNIGVGIGGNLFGNVSSVLVFYGSHDKQTRTLVQSWLDESFNLPSTLEFSYNTQSIYSASYSNEY